MPAAVLVLLLSSWLLLPSPLAMLWALVVLGTAPFLAVSSDLSSKPIDLPLLSHLRMTLSSFVRSVAQFLFTLALLPYEACIHLDAIVRTAVRVPLDKAQVAGVADLQRGPAVCP